MIERALVVAASAAWLLGAAPSAEARLVFERADGSQLEFPGTPRVSCGPWADDVARPSVHVTLRSSKRAGWQLSAVRRDIVLGKRINFPNDFIWNRPRKASLFVYDAPNEASTAEEESSGSMSFTRLSCSPDRIVAFSIDATLGSEFIDGDPIRVSGTFRGRVSKRR